MSIALRSSAAAARLARVRRVHISATPSATSINGIVDLSAQTQAIPKLSGSGPFPADPHFEVLGAPYSLLSVSLPASSNLYTRRGTLLGLNGTVANASSTLRVLSPLQRSLQRIPFLYQRLTSPTPLTAIISTNTPNSTFCILSLDGTADWTLAQRDALLAWCGHSIVVRPRPHEVSGRGLVALVGRGQVYQVALRAGEEFVIHRRALLAYSSPKKPEKSRLVTTSLRLQVPRVRLGLGLTEKLRQVEWIGAVQASKVWQMLGKAVWTVKMAIWGDRELLKFVGPATVLLQSRTRNRMRDLISQEDMDEYAAVESGAFAPPPPARVVDTVSVRKSGLETAAQAENPVQTAAVSPQARDHAGSLKVATVTRVGNVEFEDSDFKEFRR